MPHSMLSVSLPNLYIFVHLCCPRSIILPGNSSSLSLCLTLPSWCSRVCDQRHGGTRLEAEVAKLEESHTRAGQFGQYGFCYTGQRLNDIFFFPQFSSIFVMRQKMSWSVC